MNVVALGLSRYTNQSTVNSEFKPMSTQSVRVGAEWIGLHTGLVRASQMSPIAVGLIETGLKRNSMRVKFVARGKTWE